MRESSHSLIVKKGILEMTLEWTCLIAPWIEELHLETNNIMNFTWIIIFFFIKTNHDMVIFQNLSRFWEDIKKKLERNKTLLKKSINLIYWFLKIVCIYMYIYFRVEYMIKHPWGLVTCRVWTLILVRCSSGYIYELLYTTLEQQHF